MTLLDILEQRVKENKNTTAYIYRDQKISYEAINRDIDSLAATLANSGIKAGDCFAICLRNSPEFIITWFALAKLGAIAVHINFLVSEEEINYILKDSGSKGIVTQKEFAAKVRNAALATNAKWILLSDDASKTGSGSAFSAALEKGRDKAFPRAQPQTDTPVAILYTSGTTGKSKGAVLTHGNLASNAQSALNHLNLRNRGEVMLCILPMFHIFAWTALVISGIFLASPVVIVESITPPKPWLKMMAKWRVTLFAAVPPIYHVLGKEAKGFKRLILKYIFFRTVRNCISGAAPLPIDTLKTFESKFGKPILEGYGLTETSPCISINSRKLKKAGSVGTAIDGVTIKIIDEQGNALPQGQEGEICVQGPNVMQGYFNLPQETRETFTGDGYFKTGDIGKLDEEGFLYILDRKKDMISIKGLKVYPAQIEEIILRHRDVAEAAVIGIPVEGGDEIIKAYVAPKKGKKLNKADISQLLQKNLPPYKRPREIEIRAELPKNALQKILKRELRKEAIEKSKKEQPAHAAI